MSLVGSFLDEKQLIRRGNSELCRTLQLLPDSSFLRGMVISNIGKGNDGSSQVGGLITFYHFKKLIYAAHIFAST